MGQDINQHLVGIGLVGHQVPIGDIGHAVLSKQFDGVVAEASVETAEVTGGRGVGAKFEYAFARRVGLDGGRVIGRLVELGDRLRDQFSIDFARLVGGLPVGVSDERFP